MKLQRAISVACLALLLLAASPARAQIAFDPQLLGKMMHLLLAQPADYPEGAPAAPAVVVVLAFLGADGVVLDTTLVSGSGNPALDARSRELAGGRRWTPLQVDGTALASMAMLGVVWTPPGMSPPTAEEQRQLLELMSGRPAAPPQ